MSQKLAFVFPGQGAQSVGMGRDFFDNSPAARQVFDQVDAVCGYSVSDLCFNGPEDALKDTRNAQPALFAASVAALAACREVGLEPLAVAGHSIGEYAALVAAGSLSVTTGASLVKARGEAMADAAAKHAGTMAAVLGLDADIVKQVCRHFSGKGERVPFSLDKLVVPANDNAPGQFVISGTTKAVGDVSQLLMAAGAKRVVPLSVSGGFHSPLMRDATNVMEPLLDKAKIADPRLLIVANVTADFEAGASQVRANLAAQVAGPVRWTESIRLLVADGYTTFIECGPGTVLAGLIKRIAPDAKTYSVSDIASLAAAKEALGI